MTTEIIEQPTSQAVKHDIESTAQALKAKGAENLNKLEQCVREKPTKAILYAAAAGYGFHLLPVGSLLRVPLRLASILAKPALLGLGAAKLYDVVKDKSAR